MVKYMCGKMEDAYAVPNKSEMNIDNILCFACK